MRSRGKQVDSNLLSFKYGRRFGVELELNSLDKRDFQKHPLNVNNNEQPKGIDYIAAAVQERLCKPVEIMGWHTTNNNSHWLIKPDRSCGMELCSPVVKGWLGIKEICQVADILRQDPVLSIDQRCSLHVHIEVEDMSVEDVAKILTYWVKCEGVFLDSVPIRRKRNQYCQCIGMMDLFDHDTVWNADAIIKKLGSHKYYTANCYHLNKLLTGGNKGRRTIEFRIVENDGCADPYLIKNWLRLLVHFVEITRHLPIPMMYNPNDPWSGFCWMDPADVMQLLGFSGNYTLSKGMEQTRNWFVARLNNNISKDDSLPGVWSSLARKIAREQIESIISNIGLSEEDLYKNLYPEDSNLIYADEYKN